MVHTQLEQMLSPGARSPAHRGHSADKVLGSVTSVRTSVRSVTKGFLPKSVMDADEGFSGPALSAVTAAFG
jgi:hypothetical protein